MRENLLRHSLSESGSTQDLATSFSQVASAESLSPDLRERGFHHRRRLIQPETFAQQHGERKNLAAWIGGVRARQIVRAAVIGLIDAVALRVEIAGESYPARGNQDTG